MQTVRIKLSVIAMILAFIVHQSDAQLSRRYTISGYVREYESSETLIGVNIYLPDLLTGTVTNNYGFYSITLPRTDSVRLIFRLK